MNNDFAAQVWDHYRQHGRHDLPWRQTADPYHIMISEVMLQQTQVARVVPKYQEFLIKFPAIEKLAEARLAGVLRSWNGLGYNRRPKFLHQAAQQLNGREFPRTSQELSALPGIGPNTAGAILAYAFNQPAVFVETNIRTVFIHHFFPQGDAVNDKAILQLIGQTIDRENPREWYWALMDYGSHLKQTVGNKSKQSKSYAKQSTFQGSRRQLRGQIIRYLAEQNCTQQDLETRIQDSRLAAVLNDLVNENLISRRGRQFSL